MRALSFLVRCAATSAVGSLTVMPVAFSMTDPPGRRVPEIATLPPLMALPASV
jgi:hypothetical protein